MAKTAVNASPTVHGAESNLNVQVRVVITVFCLSLYSLWRDKLVFMQKNSTQICTDICLLKRSSTRVVQNQ